MTYRELYDLVPQVVAGNMGELDRALEHCQNLLLAAESEEDREGAREVTRRVQLRREELEKRAKGVQGLIVQMALGAHSTEGFEELGR
jgi:hypothetical protein